MIIFPHKHNFIPNYDDKSLLFIFFDINLMPYKQSVLK